MLKLGNINVQSTSKLRPTDCNLPPELTEEQVLYFSGRDVRGRMSGFGLSETELDKNMLVLGNIGAGKTNVIGHCVRQLAERRHYYPDEKIVILDVKGEYSDMLQSCQYGDITYFGINDYDNCWNIFQELLAYNEDLKGCEIRAHELSEYLFSRQKSNNNPYFAEAAALLFKCLLLYMIRKASETRDFSNLNNRQLKSMLTSLDINGWITILDSYNDFAYAKSCLANGESGVDSNGVLSEIAVMLSRIFNGSFAEKGSFSLARFIRSDKGGVVVLRSDASKEQTTLPVLGCMLDNAFKTAAAYGENYAPVTFVLDEFGRLPKLDTLEMSLSLLRSRHTHFIAGLQSIGQTENIAGKTDGKCLMDLMLNVVLLESSGSTVEYIQRRFGDIPVNIRSQLADGRFSDRTEYRPLVEMKDVLALERGEAFVRTAGKPDIFRFRFDRYSS